MIWGLNEGRQGVPKTPALPSPSVAVESYVVNPTPARRGASVANTPASTVIATPGSGMPVHRWSHPKHSYTSTQPYNKFKESMQSFETDQHRQKQEISAHGHPHRHSKGFSSFAGKENIPLGTPLHLGAPFETPGGYTEYHYAEKQNDNSQWHEFLPTASNLDRHLTQTGFQAPTLPNVLPPAAPRYSHVNDILQPSAITSSTIAQPKNDQQNHQPFGPPSFANVTLPEPNTTSKSPSSSTPSSLFAIRKNAATQPPRPKLRELPGVAHLLDNAVDSEGSSLPATSMPVPNALLEAASSGAGLPPDVFAALLQQMWNQQLIQFASSAFLSGPQPSLWPHANSPAAPQPSALAPPGLYLPTDHTQSQGATEGEAPTARADAPVSVAQSPLRNARSIPLARLRDRSQSKANPADHELPLPVHDLAVGLEPSNMTSRASVAAKKAESVSPKAPRVAQSENQKLPAGGGYFVMGGGIQAQGPSIAYADKVKNSSSAVPPPASGPSAPRRESLTGGRRTKESGGLGVVGVLSSMAPSSSRGGGGRGRRVSSSGSSRQPSTAGSGPGFQRGENKSRAAVSAT